MAPVFVDPDPPSLVLLDGDELPLPVEFVVVLFVSKIDRSSDEAQLEGVGDASISFAVAEARENKDKPG